MRLNEEMTPLEQEWARRIMAQRPENCLEAEDLIELAEVADLSTLSEENRLRMDHVVACPTCRNLLLELRDLEELHQAALKTKAPGRSRLTGAFSSGCRATKVAATHARSLPAENEPGAIDWTVGVGRLRALVAAVSTARRKLPGPARLTSAKDPEGPTGVKPQREGDYTHVPPVQEQETRRAPTARLAPRLAFGGLLAATVVLAGIGAGRVYRVSQDLTAARQQLQQAGRELATARQETQGLMQQLTAAQNTGSALAAERSQIAAVKHDLEVQTRNYVTAKATLAQRDRELRIAREENGGSPAPEDQKVVESTLQTKKIDLPRPLQIAFAPELSRDADLPQSLSLMSPVDTVVMSDAPTFSWQPVSGATSYNLVVREDERNPTYLSSFKIQEDLHGTTWQPSSGRLAPGKLYIWQVTAYRNNAPIAQARSRFEVADLRTIIHLTAAQERYRHQPLVLGILEAKAGLLDEATHQLRSVLASSARATDRQAATELLKSLDQLRQNHP
jgi:Skp family chaperone for outer membrane proteins